MPYHPTVKEMNGITAVRLVSGEIVMARSLRLEGNPSKLVAVLEWPRSVYMSASGGVSLVPMGAPISDHLSPEQRLLADHIVQQVVPTMDLAHQYAAFTSKSIVDSIPNRLNG